MHRFSVAAAVTAPAPAPGTWRLPAEWEPQGSCWFVWPRDETTWPDGRIDAARDAYRAAIVAVAAHQRVDLIVHPDLPAEARPDAPGRGPLPADVRVHEVAHADSWIRDYGPLTLVDGAGGRRCLDFDFDAWGGKYETLMPDRHVPARLAAAEAGVWPAALEAIDFVLEGGAIDTDGQGTFLSTESVVAARGQAVEEAEAVLRQHLGARKVIWLGEGVTGDDTDGHVDTLTRFVGPGRVVTCVTPDMDHPDHRALLVNRERLHAATDADGRPLEVLDLPLPEAPLLDDGSPLPATHANFLITHGVVLVPTYGGPTDAVALEVLQQCFPDREVVGIDHRALIWGFGGIHCLSMQVAA